MSEINNTPKSNDQEELSMLLKIVCFLIPLVGLILYFVWKKDYPVKSKSACQMALFGFIAGIIINVIASIM